MKRLILFSVLSAALFISGKAMAQANPGEGVKYIYRFSDFGIKAGVNMQQLVAYPFKADYSQGYTAGVYYEKRRNAIAFRAEINASTAQFTTDRAASKKYQLSNDVVADSVTKGILDVMYVNVPVMLVFKLGRHGNFLFGAQYSQLVSISDNNGAFTKAWKTEKALKDNYVSSIFGLEFEMFRKRMRLGATYAQGFTDVNNLKYPGVAGNWITGSAQAYLTYKIKRW